MSIWKNESSFCKRTLKPLLIVAGWMLVALIADKLHADEGAKSLASQPDERRGTQENGRLFPEVRGLESAHGLRE